jgi:putative two-component system hydrogenase maturation factor HypX/HoxX
MRILLISSSYNGLCQRAHVGLDDLGHDISIALALTAEDVRKAVALFQPDLMICPFLKERIPEDVYKHHHCIILHPGIKGDRGPSSLDWAIINGETEWGVTALQAVEEMDAGDIWASKNFPMRLASKASLYRREVTQAAIECMLKTVRRIETHDCTPDPLDYSKPEVRGQLRPSMKQKDRAINWSTDKVETIVRKINAADSAPGVLETGTNFISMAFMKKVKCAVGSRVKSSPNGMALSVGQQLMARCGSRTYAAKTSTSCRSTNVCFRVSIARLISNCPRPWCWAKL